MKSLLREEDRLVAAEAKLSKELAAVQTRRLAAEGAERSRLMVTESQIKARYFQAQYDRRLHEREILRAATELGSSAP
jgi:hypothetical protein